MVSAAEAGKADVDLTAPSSRRTQVTQRGLDPNKVPSQRQPRLKVNRPTNRRSTRAPQFGADPKADLHGKVKSPGYDVSQLYFPPQPAH